MKVRPLNDRVLIKRVADKETTSGGLIIPEAAKEKQARGKVIAVGNGRSDDNGDRRPLDVKKGDEVLFGKYSSTEIKLEGDDLIILKEEEILAVIEG